jgi:inhibitor of cysteine peptidase
MRIKLILIGMVLIIALSITACAPAHREVTVQLSAADFASSKNQSRSISGVQIGDVIKIFLPSNATTGFRWEFSVLSSAGMLAQDGDAEYVLPESSALGASGEEIWGFKALKRGSGNIILEYSQSWEGGTKRAWTFTGTVIVK